MLTFIGLGLFDEGDVSVKGLKLIKNADVVYAEFYTSRLVGSTLKRLQEFYQREIHLLSREEIEQAPEKSLLRDARDRDVVFLTAGDAMISTTHVDLRIRAHDQGIQTRLIHGASIVTAVCGLTGLQNYRFGKSATISFPYKAISAAPYNTVITNLRSNLHTLLFLDIQKELMSINQGIELLIHSEHEKGRHQLAASLAVGIARAGSSSPVVKADTLGRLKDYDFGPPLHVLVVPASLHFMEEEALERFAGARYVRHRD
ncbi:MAG: diphthine synthase [Euryarchaeota archaeon]|nr:diphthine synthase [Euryarchaeota archaeon]